MKKLKAILIIILIFIITYFMQVNLFSWFTIRGIMPNLFIGLTLLIGLFAGKKLGGVFGLVFGILLDFLVGKSIGFSGIFLGIIGLLGEYFDKNFSKDSLFTIIAMTMATTVIYEVGMYAVNVIKFGVQADITTFIIILAVETIYNGFIIIIFYPLIKKIGYYIEDIFKGKKILTRYY